MAGERRRSERTDGGTVPVLSARPGGPAERFAQAVGMRHPAAVFFVALLSAFVVLAGISLLLGLFVTDVLLHSGGVGRADESAVESIVADRTPFLTDASEVGSTVGGAPVLPIIVGLVALVCAFLRKWRIAAFAVFVLVVESATYRVTSLLVPRDRPSVHRLENLPVDASYPSGHTAASIAVYAGLMLLLASTTRHRPVAVAAWTVAIALPVLVAVSRMYRGMHHPLDVAGGALVGLSTLAIVVFACRAAQAAGRERPNSI
jgi:membrane-associated phospholipid phosphatase